MMQNNIENHYKKLIEYHLENKLDSPQVFIDLFAKHLDAGSPLEPYLV
jgi:undecaprenyl pyrophosphate synthase